VRQGKKNKHMKAISEKHLALVNEYFANGYNKRAAMRTVGYSEKSIEGYQHRLFNHPDIIAEIHKRRFGAQRRTDISVDRVLQEYAKIAFANFGDLLEINDDGTATLDMAGMTEEQRAALSEFQVDEYQDGKGEDARPVKKFKVKFHDKKAALDALAKHLGMFTEKVEVSGELSVVDRILAGRKRAAEARKDEKEG
jgi:phage terminase small subunit